VDDTDIPVVDNETFWGTVTSMLRVTDLLLSNNTTIMMIAVQSMIKRAMKQRSVRCFEHCVFDLPLPDPNEYRSE
jgi:hypothetical protein